MERKMLAVAEARVHFEEGHLLAALQSLLPALYSGSVPFEAEKLKEELYQALTEQIEKGTHSPRTPMRFGTSGWRGKLGEDFTYRNVALVTEAVCRVLLEKTQGAAAGSSLMGLSPGEIKKRGVLLAHDARNFGKEFCAVAAHILLSHGIRVRYIGRASTPEVSASLLETHSAFSLNFTPSHNPWMYHGYKLNPPDGGPAGSAVTAPVQAEAARLFSLEEYALTYNDKLPQEVECVESLPLYLRHLQKKGAHLVDLGRLRQTMENTSDFVIIADNVFGAAIGKFEFLLGDGNKKKLVVLHNEREPFFKGQDVEPSAGYVHELQRQLSIWLGEEKPAFLIFAVNDGDADRVMVAGRFSVLTMNKLGPLLYRWLLQKGAKQKSAARSVMTSHRLDKAVQVFSGGEGVLNETRVGFGDVGKAEGLVKMEESDGISFDGWLIDKDGLLPVLLVADMLISTGKTIEELEEEQNKLLGRFVFEKTKVALDESLSHSELKEKFHAVLETVQNGEVFNTPLGELKVVRVKSIDGYKFWLDNGMWIGFRLSGTEPVARIYAEKEGAYEEPEKEMQQDVDALLTWGGAFLSEKLRRKKRL